MRPVRAADHCEPVEELTFRITARQLRGLRTYLALLAGIIAVLTAAGLSTRAGMLLVWDVAVGLGLAVGLYAYVMYARAFTDCTAAGIRTRGLAGQRECAWPQVADIAPAYSRTATVMVATTGGARFRLGVPVTGGVMADPEFAAKVSQIQHYWRSAAQTAIPPAHQ